MTSTTRQRTRFRCTSERCRHRFAKRKRWWQAHSNEPKCPKCGRAFRLQQAVSDHMRDKHGAQSTGAVKPKE